MSAGQDRMSEENIPVKVNAFLVSTELPAEVQPLPSSPAQVKRFEDNRSSICRRILQSLESATGLAGIISTIGQMKAVSGTELYRPLTGTLQADKTGTIFRGVYYQDGKIVAHAAFEKVDIGFWESAVSCTTQLMMINLAIQLNQIQKAIQDLDFKVDAIVKQKHSERISKIRAGIHQFEDAFRESNVPTIEGLAPAAIQSLHEGIQMVLECLPLEIDLAQEASMNMFTRMKITGIRKDAINYLNMAQDSFKWLILGMQTLFECQALLGLSGARGPRLKGILEQINNIDIQAVANLASRVPYEGQELPEETWNRFIEFYPKAIKKAERLITVNSAEQRELEMVVEIFPEELRLD